MFRSALFVMLIPSLLSAQGLDEAARARAAVNRGEILRLSTVLPSIQDRFGGRVLDTFLVRRNASYAYRFTILTRDARLMDVMVDAATGKVISVATERQTGGGDRAGDSRRSADDDRPDEDRDDQSDRDDSGDDDDGDDGADNGDGDGDDDSDDDGDED